MVTPLNDCRPKPLNSWYTVKQAIATVYQTSGIDAAINHLISENKKRGSARCTAPIKADIHGNPTLAYCGRWECWKCGGVRLWLARRDVLSGAYYIWHTYGALWFVTLYPDTTPDQTPDAAAAAAWTKQLDTLINALSRKAKAAGVDFAYVSVIGFKPSNGQVHAHLLCNWLPDDTRPDPTPDHEHRHSSVWMKSRAKSIDSDVWIEAAADPDAVANYTADNLKSTLRADLPRNFRRLRFSRSWQRVSKADQRQASTGDDLLDAALSLGATITEITTGRGNLQTPYLYTHKKGDIHTPDTAQASTHDDNMQAVKVSTTPDPMQDDTSAARDSSVSDDDVTQRKQPSVYVDMRINKSRRDGVTQITRLGSVSGMRQVWTIDKRRDVCGRGDTSSHMATLVYRQVIERKNRHSAAVKRMRRVHVDKHEPP